MLIITARHLPVDLEMPAGLLADRPETDRTPSCEPVPAWDEIVKKWPKERFPSIISVNYSH